MGDESALLAAILAHPDEDTPRLMYADWLQEHGQPERAEFIRIQCDPDADEENELRATELESPNRVKWLAGLPQFPDARWEFRRGFPEYLDVRAALFLERYEAFARVPWLRFLSLYGTLSTELRDFANRPWSPHWVGLEVEGTPDGTRAAIALVNCSQVSQLQRLLLLRFTLTPALIDALATSPHLSNLEQLLLEDIGNRARFAPLRERFGERLVIG